MTTPQKPIEFHCKDFEKMPKKTQEAMAEMVKCAYNNMNKTPAERQPMTPPKGPAERAAEKLKAENMLPLLLGNRTIDELVDHAADIITAEYASIEQENQRLREALKRIKMTTREQYAKDVAQQALATGKRL